jgi:hypothetical protein
MLLWDFGPFEYIWLCMMIMSMGWDYVSELLPPTSLLFIPQGIYDNREPWCNDIDRRNSWFVQELC